MMRKAKILFLVYINILLILLALFYWLAQIFALRSFMSARFFISKLSSCLGQQCNLDFKFDDIEKPRSTIISPCDSILMQKY